jgi:methyl acetate hydrolase
MYLCSNQIVLQLFSTTKLVTAVRHSGPDPNRTSLLPFNIAELQIACHQLVDQGKISLHDPDVIAKYCPELGELDILEGYDAEGKEILSKPRNRITLNMLLTHTSGE